MIRRLIPVAVAVCCASPALAQSDPAGMARVAAANQLGVLEFCQARGDVGAGDVDAERGVIGRLPASAVSTTASEALGREGTLAAPNGARMSLADTASRQGTTVSALCKQLGSSTRQAAAAFAQAGAAPGGMPGMPAMPSMPGMPAMTQMPSMPGMPAMPQMPSAPGVPPSR